MNKLMSEQTWVSTGERLPDNGVVVETKLDYGKSFSFHQKQTLKRSGNLWFVPDGKMYVYYTPSHWREL